jgi:hypothetical protein
VDKSNSFNVKRANQDLIKNLTNIKQTRKQKLSDYLNQYVQIIVSQLKEQAEGQDWRQKEALLYAFGILTDKIAKDKEYLNSVE